MAPRADNLQVELQKNWVWKVWKLIMFEMFLIKILKQLFNYEVLHNPVFIYLSGNE